MKSAVPLKRLRFEYHPSVDESICGALAAACHDQRLPSIASALEGGGLHLTRPGSMQFATEDDLVKLSVIMRTDIDRLKVLAFAFTDRKNTVALGDLRMPRGAFDCATRRIGPISLLDKPHHRSAWLNRLLPYCPKSLERLVDACPTCGPLGWRHTRGIANCENCRKPVPASPGPGLDAHLADDYSLVAGLMSRDADSAWAATQELPATLREFPRTTLVEVLVRLGAACTFGVTAGVMDDLRQRPPAALAGAMCEGIRMLRGWPHSIRDYVDRRTEAMEDDLSAYETLRVALRRIAGRTSEGRALVSAAFPKIDGRTAETFAGATPYYTASQANTKLWTVSRELKMLRNAGAVRFEKLPSRVRLRARYHAEDVDALGALLANCTAPGSAAVGLGVPTYAMEQIAMSRAGMVIDHAGVVALRGPQVATDALKTLVRDLRGKAREGRVPTNYVTLRNALAVYPGEKPWDLVVEAILAGTMGYHATSEHLLLRDVLVDPSRVSSLGRQVERVPAHPLAITHVSMRDACEIMVTTFDEGKATMLAADLDIVPFGAGKGIARDAFHNLVSKIAFAGEAAANTGRNGIELHHEFTHMGVPRIHEAWSRRALAALGMVRPLPASSAPRTVAFEPSSVPALAT